MITPEDWQQLERACWGHEGGEVRVDGYLLRRLMAEVERLRADAARLDWIDRADGPDLDRLVDELGRGRSRQEIDRVAGEEATWLAK